MLVCKNALYNYNLMTEIKTKHITNFKNLLSMKNFTYSWMRGILVAVCLMAVPLAFAANITVNGINYTTATGQKATVAKYTIDKTTTPYDTLYYEGDIVIPEVITYEGVDYTVVATAANSFLDCKNLTSLVLPNTCVTIGRNSFKGCTSLKVSPIPETVTSVGNGALNGCSGLEEVTVSSGWGKIISEQFSGCPLKKMFFVGTEPVEINIEAFGKTAEALLAPKSMEEIYFGCNINSSNYENNKQPFHNFTALKKVTFGENATTINNTMFQGCTALTQVVFENGNQVNAINAYAFQNCTSLPSFAFPAGVTTVENSVFQGCSSMATVTLSPATTSIGVSSFYNTGLTGISLPSTVTSIGATAFTNSNLAGTITFPEGLTGIGSQAFANTRLSGISLPSTVTSIGTAAFAPIPNLASITLAGGNTAFKLTNGVLTNMAGTRLLVTAHRGNIGNTYSDATVETIDNYGLAYAPFETVTLPALNKIGDYGFAFSAIRDFNLGSNVNVGLNIFNGSDLETLVIANGRNEIPQGLAADCINLISVTLPTTATNMMRNCFAGCTELEEMEIPVNVNYMEPGSVPTTIQSLRVLNPAVPVLAPGVFTADQSGVTCEVATSSVSDYEAANQWSYLDIVGDATIPTAGVSLGCPTGLYFATTDGKLLYRDEDGNIIDTEFNAGAHAFTLSNYKNRIYVADAGERFNYQDPNQPLGDGQLFYVNKTNDIFYRVTVLNNVGYAPSEDPFTMYIDPTENMIYISDRNVGIHEMSADAVGLYGSQPFFMQNQWLPFYNDYISWGSITGGFTRDSQGVYWMSKKFNGLGIIRFRKTDIYSDGNINGKPYNFGKLFADDIIKTFYLDEKNGYLWMHVMKDHNGCVPGIYRIALSTIAAEDAANADNLQSGWTSNIKIADCQLIDDSPIRSSNSSNEASGEIDCIAQIYGDGENIYWGYIAPVDDDHAIAGSTPLDISNPLHHSGIKTCKAADANPTVTFAVPDVEAFGITGATFIPETTIVPGDANGDGNVTVLDVTAVINYVLGKNPTPFVFDNADVNGDGNVTVLDVTAIINIILNN